MPPWSDDQEQRAPISAGSRTGGTTLAATFDGHVARSGSCHRRRRHHRARGNGAVRKAQKAVKVRILRALAAGPYGGGRLRGGVTGGSAPAWRVELRARHADVALYHLGNNQLHREIYRRALAAAWRGGAARCRAASFLPRLARSSRLHRRVRLQLRRVASRAGRASFGAPAPALVSIGAFSITPC